MDMVDKYKHNLVESLARSEWCHSNKHGVPGSNGLALLLSFGGRVYFNHGSARHSNSTNLTQPWAPPEALLRKEPYQIWFTCFFKSFLANLRKTFREIIPWMMSWLLVRVHISCRFFSVCKMWEHDFMMNNTQFLKLPPNQAQWNFKQLIWLLD